MIVAVPTDIAVTLPLVTVATLVFDEDQVMVLSVAFSGAMVAVKVVDSPTEIVVDVVLSLIDVTTGSGAGSSEQELLITVRNRVEQISRNGLKYLGLYSLLRPINHLNLTSFIQIVI